MFRAAVRESFGCNGHFLFEEGIFLDALARIAPPPELEELARAHAPRSTMPLDVAMKRTKHFAACLAVRTGHGPVVEGVVWSDGCPDRLCEIVASMI